MSMSIGEWSFLIFIAMMLLFSVTSNILVVIVMMKNKKLRNVTNTLICNLALSDILLGGFVLPQNLHDLSHEHDYHEGIVLCKMVNAMPIWCITCSIYSLVVISFERKRSIVYSLSKQISIEHCKFIIPSLWIASTLVTTPTLVSFGEVDLFDKDRNKTYTSCGAHLVTHTFSFVNGIFLLLFSYIIPLFVIWYNYYGIIRFVLKQGKEVKPSGNQTNGSLVTTSSVIFKKRIQIVKMLIIVAVLFAVSWIPYFITLIIAKVSGKDASEHASGTENMMKIFLAAFSTAYNVVLYVVFNANFRRGLKEILCCSSKTQFRPEKPNKNKELSVVPSVSKKTTKSVMKTTE